MDDLTKGTEVVITEAVEEVVTKIGVATILTGVCAATGVLTIAYGVYRVGKWGVDKVKTAKDNKVTKLEAEEVNDDVTGVEEE